MSQGIDMEEEEGGFLAIPVRLVEGGRILDGALGGVKGCSHLGDRTQEERKRDVLLELAHEHVCRQARVAHLLGEEDTSTGKNRYKN